VQNCLQPIHQRQCAVACQRDTFRHTKYHLPPSSTSTRRPRFRVSGSKYFLKLYHADLRALLYPSPERLISTIIIIDPASLPCDQVKLLHTNKQHRTCSGLTTSATPLRRVSPFFVPACPYVDRAHLQIPRGTLARLSLPTDGRHRFQSPLLARPSAARRLSRASSRLHRVRSGAHVALGFRGAAHALR